MEVFDDKLRNLFSCIQTGKVSGPDFFDSSPTRMAFVGSYNSIGEDKLKHQHNVHT